MGRDSLQDARPPAKSGGFYNKFTDDDSNVESYSQLSSEDAQRIGVGGGSDTDLLPEYKLWGPEGGWDLNKSYLDQPTRGTNWDPLGRHGWDSPFRAAGVHYVRWSDTIFSFAGRPAGGFKLLWICIWALLSVANSKLEWVTLFGLHKGVEKEFVGFFTVVSRSHPRPCFAAAATPAAHGADPPRVLGGRVWLI